MHEVIGSIFPSKKDNKVKSSSADTLQSKTFERKSLQHH